MVLNACVAVFHSLNKTISALHSLVSLACAMAPFQWKLSIAGLIACCVHDCAILPSFSFQKLFCTQKAKNYRLAFLCTLFFPQSCEVETSVRSVSSQISLPISPLTPFTHVGEDFIDAKSELPMTLPHWHIWSPVPRQNISDM